MENTRIKIKLEKDPDFTPNTSQNAKHKKAKIYATIHPWFISHTATTKFHYLKHNLQIGFVINLEKGLELREMFFNIKWDPIVFPKTRKVYNNLVGEFYCNMGIGKSINGILYLASVVCGRPILIDNVVLSKALHLDPKLNMLSKINITRDFIFDKTEFRLLITTFFGSEIPETLFNTSMPMSFDRFTPMFHLLALIVRANILPKPNHDELFDFTDLKFMYLLFTRRVYFSLPYVILLKMIQASQIGFMPYGLLLTTIFEFLGFDVTNMSHYIVSASIDDKTKRTPLPLCDYVHDISVHVGLPTDICDVHILSVKVNDLSEDITNLKTEICMIKYRNTHLSARVDFMMTMLASAISRTEAMEGSVNQMFQIQFGIPSADPFMDPIEQGDVQTESVLPEVKNEENTAPA